MHDDTEGKITSDHSTSRESAEADASLEGFSGINHLQTMRVGYTLWHIFSRPDNITFSVALTHDGTVNSVSNNPTIPELEAALRYLKAKIGV